MTEEIRTWITGCIFGGAIGFFFGFMAFFESEWAERSKFIDWRFDQECVEVGGVLQSAVGNVWCVRNGELIDKRLD